MAFMTTPGDVLAITNAARRLDPNPFSLAGKVIGFGADEQKAGIPVWAWLTVGIGIGVILGWKLAPLATKTTRRLVAFE